MVCLVVFTVNLLSSFTMAKPTSTQKDREHQTELMWDLAFYVPVSESYYYNGCTITITAVIVFYFNESTFQLTNVILADNYNIEIDCTGPPVYYTRSGSEITFDISSNEVSDVHFPVTGYRDIDDFFGNNGFKVWFLNLANNNMPK